MRKTTAVAVAVADVPVVRKLMGLLLHTRRAPFLYKVANSPIPYEMVYVWSKNREAREFQRLFIILCIIKPLLRKSTLYDFYVLSRFDFFFLSPFY